MSRIGLLVSVGVLATWMCSRPVSAQDPPACETTVEVCPDDFTLGCEPFDEDVCGEPGVREPTSTCLANGTNCLGCTFCDFPCPELPCTPLPMPCDLVLQTTYRLNGKTCPGCPVCKQCPPPVGCSPVDPSCDPEDVYYDVFTSPDNILCRGCGHCSECGNGIVEPTETCEGEAPCCTANCDVADASTVCRAATSPCDAAEQCTGTATDCPADALHSDGTTCDDDLACTGASECDSGTCMATSSTLCDDGDACTADMCAEPAGCSATPIVGCCHDAADCDDADPCTTDSCEGTGGTASCQHSAVASCMDAGVPPLDDAGVDGGPDPMDAGAEDAGAEDASAGDASTGDASAGDAGSPAPSGGCSLVVSDTARHGVGAWLVALAVALAAWRRTRPQ